VHSTIPQIVPYSYCYKHNLRYARPSGSGRFSLSSRFSISCESFSETTDETPVENPAFTNITSNSFTCLKCESVVTKVVFLSNTIEAINKLLSEFLG